MGEKRNVYRLLVGKPEGKRPLGRPRHRWADKLDLVGTVLVGCGLDWSASGQAMVRSYRECDNERAGSIKYRGTIE
jgi:hypothetical protein